jgi:hypothetical protein
MIRLELPPKFAAKSALRVLLAIAVAVAMLV